MSGWTIRPAAEDDVQAVASLLAAAFGGDAEATLVAALRSDGDVLLELVAEKDGALISHILFSRLRVETKEASIPAVALAPLAVSPACQGQGAGSALVREGHARLRASEEALSMVLGDPAFYGRFGYSRARAAAFESGYQCDALQALAWSESAPERGRLVYPPAFAAL